MIVPQPSTSGLFSTCFKAVTQRENQIRSWYDIESHKAYEQVDPRSAVDARAEKIFQETTYQDGSRHHVGMFWAIDQISLPNNFFSALVQLKSLERRPEKDAILKEQYSTTIREDLSKGYIIKVKKYFF